jgi:predicted glycoside hydrolase/deacetylase ChbG (UPF0249 family)
VTTGALVVNADDLGVSRGATLGIIAAHRDGIVSSASLAVTTDFYDHALETCVRGNPGLGCGLHLTLTSGKPVSPPCAVPLLVGGDGFFRWRFLPLLRAASRNPRSTLLDQIELEIEAQLQRLARDGVRVDHIDGERHVHLIPGIFERVAAAAKRHHIPYVRMGREIGLLPGSGQALVVAAGGGFAKSWLLSALSRRARGILRRDGGGQVRSADHFASYVYSGRLDLVLERILAGPPRPGVTEIMVHPGNPGESREIVLGNRELERYVALDDRRKELDACIAARRWLTEDTRGPAQRSAGHPARWRLTSFRDLANESGT